MKEDKGPRVIKNEILTASAELKDEKTVGVDEIPAEMLKSLGEKAYKKYVTFVSRCMKKKNGQIISQEQS